jgi:hypothetical protein
MSLARRSWGRNGVDLESKIESEIEIENRKTAPDRLLVPALRVTGDSSDQREAVVMGDLFLCCLAGRHPAS